MSDLIDRQEVLKLFPKYDYKHACFDLYNAIKDLPSAQPEPCEEVQHILDYLDNVLHPLVSPEHWNVYSELYDMIAALPSAQPEKRTEERTETHGVCLDAISRQAAIDAVTEHAKWLWKTWHETISLAGIIDVISNLPSAQPNEQCDNCHYKHIWMTQRMNGIDYPGHGGATG